MTQVGIGTRDIVKLKTVCKKKTVPITNVMGWREAYFGLPFHSPYWSA